ncbi:MAG: trimethylamine methyltransferase family protein [bacterium]
MDPQHPRLTILDDKTIEKVLDEAMELLEKAGVTVEDEETLDILGQTGAGIARGEHKAMLKCSMVESAIASAPKSLALFGLDGSERFRFGDGQIHFNPGSAALFVLDSLGSGAAMRKPTLDDLARFARLTHTLENIEAASTGVVPGDVPQEVSDSLRLYASCLYSTKPVVTGTFSEKGFDVMRDLLLARTGAESLRERPCAIFDVCPSSPLRWSHLGCHDLRLCAQNAVPAQLISMPLAGALAPMSLMASVVQHAAETLSGVVIHQAWTPGSPIIYGGSPAVFDMRHSTSPMGAVETLMIDLAYTEVGKYLGFPTQAYLGMSDAKVLDAQAGMETAMTILVAATGRVDFISGPGMLNFENCQSLEKLVLDNEICGMARRLKRGLEPRGKSLGFDAVMEGLAEGNFFTLDDTLRLYKEEAYYPGKVIDRKPLKEEGAVDGGRLGTVAREEVERRLKAYQQPAIGEAALRDLKAVMTEALSEHGVGSLVDKLT